MIKKILSLLFICASLLSEAQLLSESGPQMADKFREDGKIYVVIAVIALVFLALVAFLVYIERKLKKVEEKVDKVSGQ